MTTNIFSEAKKIYDTLTVSDIQTELEMLDAFLSINGSTPLLEEDGQNQETEAVYSFNPSKILIFLAEYLSRKNNNETRSIAIFMKIIEVIYQIDKHDPDSFILIDIAAYVFRQQLENMSNN